MALGYLDIADHFEQQILSGELKVNDRLPTTTELSEQFGVAPLTVQRSLQRLSKKGLVVRKRRAGTFVCGPQHGAKSIAVVFGSDPFQLESPFYRLVLQHLTAAAARSSTTVQPYLSLHNQINYGLFQDLENKLREGQVNCVASLCSSRALQDWLELQRGVPWVELPGLDVRDMAYKGAKHLLSKGKRDMLTLSLFPVGKDAFVEPKTRERAGVRDAFEEFGLDSTGHEPVYCGQLERDGYDYVKTFLESGQSLDSVLVLHDVLCRGVITALLEKGRSIPGDTGLVTHCNKGADIVAPVSLTRLQVNPEKAAHDMLHYIETTPLAPGKNVPGEIMLTELIEGESV